MTIHMTLKLTAVAATLVLSLGLTSAQAGEPIKANGADTLANSDGTVTFPKHNFGRTGQWNSNSSVTGVLVLPFALPELAEGETISSATLAINLEGWRNLERGIGDVDLYAIRVSAKPDVLASDYINGELAKVIDGKDDDAAGSDEAGDEAAESASGKLPEGVVLIQDGFLPASQIDNFKMEVNKSITTSEAGSAALGAWIQSQYDDGAKAGQFVFVALTIDNASKASDGSYYLFSTSEGEIAPTLTLSTGDPQGAEQGEAAEADETEDATEEPAATQAKDAEETKTE